jgi:hypothetical protein
MLHLQGAAMGVRLLEALRPDPEAALKLPAAAEEPSFASTAASSPMLAIRFTLGTAAKPLVVRAAFQQLRFGRSVLSMLAQSAQVITSVGP